MNTTQNADLSALRLRRDQDDYKDTSRLPWKIIIPSGIVILGIIGWFLIKPLFSSVKEVEFTSATLSSPAQANAVLNASGYGCRATGNELKKSLVGSALYQALKK